MKLSAGSLRHFLLNLPHYESLSVVDRRALASIERPSQSCSAFVLRGSLDALIAAGFLRPATPDGRCSVAVPRQEFIRTLRVLRAHPVLHMPGQTTFDGYLDELLTSDEREALLNNFKFKRWERNVLYREIISPDWVQAFLEAKDKHWESISLAGGGPLLFTQPEVLSDAQKIVRNLMARGGRMALRDLSALEPDVERLSIALHAALRYALLFAAIDPDTMDAILGVWPTIVTEPSVAGMLPPRNVTPDETFDPLFLPEDMTSLLVACATEPLPLKISDGQLHSKTIVRLADAFRPLPQWVNEAFQINTDYRVHIAAWLARNFRLVGLEGHPPQLVVNGLGREWLGLPIGDRLRLLMDGILGRQPTLVNFRDFIKAGIDSIGQNLRVETRLKPKPDIPAAVMQPFQSLGEGFFPVQEIIAHSQTTNPLVAIYRKDKSAYFSSDVFHYLYHPDAEMLRKAWTETLHLFLRTRLLPLGAVRVGLGKEGASIAITPAGRYYLGQSNWWKWETIAANSQVIVQPNFEVTFLGESPAVEAEIGRFAERRGQRIGALFQITKKSIFAAAASGMTAESVLEVLERVCTREVPVNVRREIQGWFGQCRNVSLESVVLIRCQDRETALRVIALAKGFATALNDTVLEYRDPGRQRPGLIKKLRELGVLVEEKAGPEKENRLGW